MALLSLGRRDLLPQHGGYCLGMTFTVFSDVHDHI